MLYLSYHFYLCDTTDILEKVIDGGLSLQFEDDSFMIKISESINHYFFLCLETLTSS